MKKESPQACLGVGQQKYQSLEAMLLAKWALDVKDRKKALRMKRVADKMEDKKRKYNEGRTFVYHYNLI